MQTHQPYHLSAKCQTAEPISPRISWLLRSVKRKLCPKLTDGTACVRSVDFSSLDLADLHRASFLHGLGGGRRDEDWRQAVLPGDLRLRAVDDRLGKGPLLGDKGHGVAIPHDLVQRLGDFSSIEYLMHIVAFHTAAALHQIPSVNRVCQNDCEHPITPHGTIRY